MTAKSTLTNACRIRAKTMELVWISPMGLRVSALSDTPVSFQRYRLCLRFINYSVQTSTKTREQSPEFLNNLPILGSNYYTRFCSNESYDFKNAHSVVYIICVRVDFWL